MLYLGQHKKRTCLLCGIAESVGAASLNPPTPCKWQLPPSTLTGTACQELLTQRGRAQIMPKDLSAGSARAQEPVLIHSWFRKVRGEWQGCCCWQSSEDGTEDAAGNKAVPWGAQCPPTQDTQPHGPSLGHWVTSRHVLQGAFLTLAQRVPAWSCQQCSYSSGREEKHQHLLPQMSQLGKTSKPQTSASHAVLYICSMEMFLKSFSGLKIERFPPTTDL